MKKTLNKKVDKQIVKDNFLYKRPDVMLFSKEQWSYIRKRYKITVRELEISMLICSGLSSKEIARELHIEKGTVKIHTRNVYRKVCVKNRILLLLRFMDDINRFFGQSG
ncbi:MAG: response regulator transcription factor [Candidatus Hodarchaeota archaeon]